MAIPLYERLIGPSWREVHPAVRRVHLDGDQLRARGVFRVQHGKNVLAKALVWLIGLPLAAESVTVHLVISVRGQGEEWARTFGRKRMVSIQHEGGPGIMVERWGPTELRFQMGVKDGDIVYAQQGSALALGRMRLPMPGWIAPRVSATETVGATPDHAHVSVNISLPLIGLLISYAGELRPEKPS